MRAIVACHREQVAVRRRLQAAEEQHGRRFTSRVGTGEDGEVQVAVVVDRVDVAGLVEAADLPLAEAVKATSFAPPLVRIFR
jgi:hypothetical protein